MDMEAGFQMIQKGMEMVFGTETPDLKTFHEIYTSWIKIQNEKKDNDVIDIKLKESVAQELFDLEIINKDVNDLKGLYIEGAIQIDLPEKCKAVVIQYPFRLRKSFRKNHLQLVTELEKKFSGNVVVLIPKRSLDPSPAYDNALLYDAMMRDIVHPIEILGKCVECAENEDEPDHIKYFLDSESRNDTEDKLQTFAAVFENLCLINGLCALDVSFEYKEAEVISWFQCSTSDTL